MTRYATRLLTIAAWWWLMMAVHELGHVIGCLASGATVEAVILWPWTISETVRSGSQAPLIDTWAGPLLGMLLPVVAWLICRRQPKLSAWVAGWVGFCLVANGVYLAAGWVEPAGDASDLMRLGMPVWVLFTVGVAAVLAGLWCWHRQLERNRARS